MNVKLKRIYDPVETSDGERYLVDRLWPRGISKSRAALDGWLKTLAPSSELRKWFGHRPERWLEFRQRYGFELSEAGKDLDWLAERAKHQNVTLIYAARDREISHAVVLREHLLGRLSHSKSKQPGHR